PRAEPAPVLRSSRRVSRRRACRRGTTRIHRCEPRSERPPRAWRNSSRRGPLRVSFLLIGSTRSRGCAAPSPNPNELTSRDGERFPGVRIALLALESQRDRASLGARRQRLRVERPGAHPCPTETEPDFPTRSFARSSLTHVRTP